MRDEFTTFDIIKTLGIPRERLQDWMNRGFIEPTTPAKGKGTKAIFTRNDVYGVELFKSFVKQGLSRGFAGKYCGNLKEHGRFGDYKILFIARWDRASGGYELRIRADVTHIVAPEDMSPEMKKINKDYQENLKDWDNDDGERRFLDHYLGGLLEEYHKEFGTPQYREPQDVIQDFFKDGRPSVSSGDRKEWDQLHVINIEKVRRKVDMALSGLE